MGDRNRARVRIDPALSDAVAKAGALSATADPPSFCSSREPVPGRYTFEAKIRDVRVCC